MRKMILFLFLAISMIGTTPAKVVHADNSFYAKVQQSGVNLYSMPSQDSAMFEIPNSYFVKIDYVVEDYFKVTYKDLDGYVKKSEVALMNGTPKQAYPMIQPSTWVNYNLYEKATRESRAITELPASQSVEYYGAVISEDDALPGDYVWFYVSLTTSGSTVRGYVYNRAFAPMSIPENKEEFKIVSEELLTSSGKKFSSLSVGTKVILIVAISVPSVLILYFLIKPSRIMQNAKTHKKPKKAARKIHHGDYYEFDESEL